IHLKLLIANPCIFSYNNTIIVILTQIRPYERRGKSVSGFITAGTEFCFISDPEQNKRQSTPESLSIAVWEWYSENQKCYHGQLAGYQDQNQPENHSNYCGAWH